MVGDRCDSRLLQLYFYVWRDGEEFGIICIFGGTSLKIDWKRNIPSW